MLLQTLYTNSFLGIKEDALVLLGWGVVLPSVPGFQRL